MSIERDKLVAACARAGHEAANVAYTRAVGLRGFAVWEQQKPDFYRECADAVERVLRGASPLEVHEGWRADLMKEGWSPAPGAPSTNLKTDPRLVPYEELSQHRRSEYIIFVAVVRAVATELGLKEADE